MNIEKMRPTKDDIYEPVMDSRKDDAMFTRVPNRRSRPLVGGFAFIALCYLLWSTVSRSDIFSSLSNLHTIKPDASQDTKAAVALVPLEAHIMSKCPDAKDCLKMMVLPTMQRVYDKVNFTLSYIGTPTENDGVDCMHGPEECMGNIIELCAANLYPDPKIYLGFTMCLSRDYKDIPQKGLVEDCALEHGIDISKLNDCAVEDNGGFAMGMLRDSVRRSKEVGVVKSCTVRLNEEIYCIRDGGQWKDCPSGPGVNDLVIAIEKLYQGSSEAQISPSIAH